MKKIGLAAAVACALGAAAVGLNGPAYAVAPGDETDVLEMLGGVPVGVDHLNWLEDIRPKVNVPDVDSGGGQHP